MNSKTQELATYDGSKHDRGASKFIYGIWCITNSLLFRHSFLPLSKLKVSVLRVFGAKIGDNVLIKPCVNIRYPWKLQIGDNCWIGEEVWIENLSKVTMGNNVCISQNAMLISGSHDYSITTFDDNSSPIVLEDGVWIGARAVVGRGVTCGRNSILSINSVAEKNLAEDSIYLGHPARFAKKREVL